MTSAYKSLVRTRLERPRLCCINYKLGNVTGLSLDFQKEGKAALQRPNSRAGRAQLLWHRLAFAGMQGVTTGSGQEPGLRVGEITAKMFFSPKIHVQKEKNIFVKQAATSTVQGKLGLVQCLKKRKLFI